MIRRPYSTLFLDVALGLVVLLFLLIHPPTPSADTKPRAEYTLTMQWELTDSRVDMDIYVRLPDGCTAWYGNKDCGLVFVDRDHLGRMDDSPVRREDVQFLRPVEPGSYLVSMNNYQGPAEGRVMLELVDKRGEVLWTAVHNVPPHRVEVPLVQLQFGADGQLIATEETDLSVRQLLRR